MRISTISFHNQGINSIIDAETTVNRTQLQIAAGKKIIYPSDDPVKSSQILALNQDVANTTQLNSNADYATTRNQLIETTLSAIETTLFRIRDLILQGKNSALPQSSVSAIKEEITLSTNELIGLANSKDGSGEYIFGGSEGRTLPFTRDPASGSLIYTGDQGQRFVKVGFNVQVPVSDSGYDVFQNNKQGNGYFSTNAGGFVDILNTNTANALNYAGYSNTGSGIINAGAVTSVSNYIEDNYEIQFVSQANGQLGFNVYAPNNTPHVFLSSAVDASDSTKPVSFVPDSSIEFNGIKIVITGSPNPGDKFSITPSHTQSLFATLENVIKALDITDDTERSNILDKELTNIDQAFDTIEIVHSRIGARLNSVEIEQDLNDSYLIYSRSSLSKLQDLDFAKAASDLTQQSLALEAAQSSFVKIQSLSLFNYLR